MFRYKLRTLLIVLAIAPLVLAIFYWTWPNIRGAMLLVVLIVFWFGFNQRAQLKAR